MSARLHDGLRDRDVDDAGFTLVELTVTSAVLMILLGMVFITFTMIEGLSSGVSSQYQSFQQTLPAMAPLHSLLAAEVEPAPPSGGVPTPGFDSIGNFNVTFYANVGTAYANTVSCPSGQTCATGTTAGPAKVVALLLAADGTPATACSVSSPCTFQLRMFLPVVGLTAPGVSSCPGVGTGPACVYPTAYRLLANVQNVVNDPSTVDANGDPTSPLFHYTMFDTGGTYGSSTYGDRAIPLSAGEVSDQQLSGLIALGYPVDTRSLGACDVPSATYPTAAIACPADAIQSVAIDLKVAKPGSGTNGGQENTLVVYRYAQSPGSSTAPYQYSASVG
jgi:hypothetical protein